MREGSRGAEPGEPWGTAARLVIQRPASCVGPNWCSAGTPWEAGAGAQAPLGFHGNSREEPGNTSSGRKAAAERRASLFEQAPDTLSVQLSGPAGQPGPVFLPLGPPPYASQSGPRAASGKAVFAQTSVTPAPVLQGWCPGPPQGLLVGQRWGSLRVLPGGLCVDTLAYPGLPPRLPCPGLAWLVFSPTGLW